MSSSRSKGKEKSNSQSSYYPTRWADWEWNDQLQCKQRYRLRDSENYEYEYDPPQYEDKNVPRTPQPYMGPVAEPSQYSGNDNYKTSTSTAGAVENITQALTQTNLGSSSQAQQDVPSDLPNIRTRDRRTNREKFDPVYRVHHQREFKWGRIFKVLWTEPKGNNGNGGETGARDSEATLSVREGKHGEMHYEKVRRFLIVNPMNGHCICLPINTYGSKGVMKPGVHADHHTIIHTGKPVYLSGEWEKGLGREPILMNPDTPRDKLFEGSRLNYAKPYTVEYNVKVCFIGKVHSGSRERVAVDYNILHPPVQAPPLPVPESSANTFSHAEGGNTTAYQPSYSQYPLLNQAAQNTAPSAPYTGAISQYSPAPYSQQVLSSESAPYPSSTVRYDSAATSQYLAGPSATGPGGYSSQDGGQTSSRAGGSGGDGYSTNTSGSYDPHGPYPSQRGSAEQSSRSSTQPSSRGNQKYREDKYRRPR